MLYCTCSHSFFHSIVLALFFKPVQGKSILLRISTQDNRPWCGVPHAIARRSIAYLWTSGAHLLARPTNTVNSPTNTVIPGLLAAVVSRGQPRQHLSRARLTTHCEKYIGDRCWDHVPTFEGHVLRPGIDLPSERAGLGLEAVP